MKGEEVVVRVVRRSNSGNPIGKHYGDGRRTEIHVPSGEVGEYYRIKVSTDPGYLKAETVEYLDEHPDADTSRSAEQRERSGDNRFTTQREHTRTKNNLLNGKL